MILGIVSRFAPFSRPTPKRGALVASVERRGCEPPLHRHRNEDEIVYVLEGALTFYLDGELRALRAGDCLLLPRGVEHGYRVESEEARLLTVVMPAGLEGYYMEVGGHEAAGDIERLVAVAARYDIAITGRAVTQAPVWHREAESNDEGPDVLAHARRET